MNYLFYLIFAILFCAAIAGIVLLCSHVLLIRTGTHLKAVATVAYWQPSKLPMFGRVCLRYTKRGAPHLAMSQLIWKGHRPRDGSSAVWDIVIYRVKNQIVQEARLPQKTHYRKGGRDV